MLRRLVIFLIGPTGSGLENCIYASLDQTSRENLNAVNNILNQTCATCLRCKQFSELRRCRAAPNSLVLFFSIPLHRILAFHFLFKFFFMLYPNSTLAFSHFSNRSSLRENCSVIETNFDFNMRTTVGTPKCSTGLNETNKRSKALMGSF